MPVDTITLYADLFRWYIYVYLFAIQDTPIITFVFDVVRIKNVSYKCFYVSSPDVARL